MSRKRQLNGCGYLMLGFDRELRRRGYAGNSCQIIVELATPVDPAALRARLSQLLSQDPLLAARPAGWLWPYFKRRRFTPVVRVQPDAPGRREQLFNEPLDLRRGELIRFDLIPRNGQAMDLIFTWSHALMDARAAEHFLIQVGNPDLPIPADPPASQAAPPRPLKERLHMAWQATCHVEQIAQAAPRPLRAADASIKPLLKYHIEKFSAAETAGVRENATRLCGFLGLAQFDAAAALLELHHLHQRAGSNSPSYCLPLPVGLRPKGSSAPLFSNQVAMLMLQFFPHQFASLSTVVAALKSQTEQALRTGLLDNGLMLSELSRCIPLALYMAIVKRSLGGEICSLFYGDAGNVSAALTSILGAPVTDVAHVAAVTVSPGIGVIFCRFQQQLRLTVIHAAPLISDQEAAEFTASLRQRLLNP